MKSVLKTLRQRWVLGMIVEIDLLEGIFTYAQIINDTSMLFFDILRHENEARPSTEKILRSKPLFEIAVYSSVLKYWPRIGKEPILLNYVRPDKYSIDSETGTITIWKYGGGTRPGTLDEIKGLEYAAIWEPGAIEQRLRDHFAGRPSWYVEQDKPGWKRISAKEFYAQYGYDFHWLDEIKSLK